MRTVGTSRYRLAVAVAAGLTVGGFAACSDDPLVPVSVEDTSFASSLGIDLSQMERLPSGVYFEVEEEGAGDAVAAPDSVGVTYTLWLSNGLEVDAGEFGFRLGAGRVIEGFDDGVTGMRPAERRRFVVPWELGYGERGTGAIPPYANLVFRVRLDTVFPELAP